MIENRSTHAVTGETMTEAVLHNTWLLLRGYYLIQNKMQCTYINTLTIKGWVGEIDVTEHLTQSICHLRMSSLVRPQR